MNYLFTQTSIIKKRPKNSPPFKALTISCLQIKSRHQIKRPTINSTLEVQLDYDKMDCNYEWLDIMDTTVKLTKIFSISFNPSYL